MRHGRRITAVVVAAFAVGATALPAPAHALDPTVPPEVLAPVDGASVQAGSAVTFRVRTDVGDDYLWVHVSKSPTPVDACGTIGDDADIVGLEPTMSDPAVYEGISDVSPNFTWWLNRAGTYYWQAYRIHYPDGCIEAPVRSLVVTGVRPIEVGPQPIEPTEGATLATGSITFKVSAMPVDRYLWVYVSRSPSTGNLGGLIGDDVALAELHQTADPTIWSVTPDYFTFPSFWMNTPGTYFWQPHRISGFGDPDGWVEGPVRSFTLAATPTPTPTPTPAPTPVTIRGPEAFTKGTANDLYLACTKLDLLLVDVLPASRGSVWVTGAADLRLKGRTVEILLDGRRVGTTVVGPSGAFQATVRAPTRARRTRARYRARVGATLSQNLKLDRRMVAARLTRNGSTFTLTGQISRPFARRPATIGLQRYSSCRQKTTVAVKTARPNSSGRFTLRFPVPEVSAKALMYRATTSVATHAGGPPTKATFTLPRAIDVR